MSFAPKVLAGAVLLFVLAPCARALPDLYVPLSGGTVAIYDLGNHDALVARLGVGPGDSAFAASPLGGSGYVANTDAQTLSEITSGSHAPTVTSVVTLTGEPDALAYTTEGSALYAALGPQNEIAEIASGGTQSIQTITVGSDPDALALTPDDALIFVANANSNNVSVVSSALSVVLATIPVGLHPDAVAVLPEGTTVYVANGGSATVSVIDRATRTVTGTIAVGTDPVALALSPGGGHLFVADAGSDAVSVIDTATNTVTATVPLSAAPSALALDPAGDTLYVVEPSADAVAEINPILDTVTGTLALPAVPTTSGSGFVGQGDLVALSQGLSTTTNVEVTGTLGCGDTLGRTRDFSLVIPPAHGRLLLSAASGAFEYIPATNYIGRDAFAFRCESVVGGPNPVSNVATVSVAIGNGNVSISSGALGPLSLIVLGVLLVLRRRRAPRASA
jgi:YVTN family beta-propeller protein